MQLLAAAGQLAQHRQGQVVAGVNGEQVLPRVVRFGHHAREIGAQRVDVRLHARAGAELGPAR